MANQYFTCEISGWREGRQFKAYMKYYRSDGRTYTYQDTAFPTPTMDLAGTVYSDTALANAVHSGIGIGTYQSPTYSRDVAGEGNRTATWSAGSGLRSDFAGTWSTTVYFPSPYSAPSQPSVSIVERYANGAKFNVSISSYGNPSAADGRWIEAGIAGQNAWQSPSLRSAIATNTTSATITVNNSSTKTTTLTVKSNTRYYYGGYAWNTQLNNSRIAGQFYTLPAIPVGSSFESTGTTTAQFNITDASEGSGQPVQLQYAIKENSAPESGWSSWIDAGAAGNKQTRTVSLTGLTPGTSYDIMMRAKAGSSDYSGINKRKNVFTTDEVGVTITSRSSVYTSGDNSQTTLGYIITAAGGASDTFDIAYSYTDGQTTYGEYIINNAPATGTFEIATKNNTPYTLTIKSRQTGQTTWGEATTYQFTTPSFVPGAPTVSNLKWRTEPGRGFRWGVTFDLIAATPGEGEAFANTYYKVEIFDNNTSQWVEAVETQTVSSMSYSGEVTTLWDPMRYPKIALSAWQTNNLGHTSPLTKVVYQNRPLVVGTLTPPDGNRLYVVGIKTKGTDGTLNPGDYTSPVVIK